MLVLQGCCGSDPEYFDEVVHDDHDGTIEAAIVAEIRAAEPSDEGRCEAACLVIVDEADDAGGDVIACLAAAATGGDPWEGSTGSVTIACTIERIERVARPPTCGRRPHRLHADVEAVSDAGGWFAAVARLEAASVIAFEELAAALSLHGAPASLVSRCRSAADDERVHARLFTTLARRAGRGVAAVSSDAAPTSLVAIALHNAIEGCVHEAFAAILAAHQARHAPGDLRPAFARIADDECRHGQLAWELHDWLVARLAAEGRERVEVAWRGALDGLPALAAAQAHDTPAGLGWPTPARAAAMALSFARLARSGLASRTRCDDPCRI